MNQQDKLIRALVKRTLQDATKFKWTLQGFGMLRLYLPEPNVRMSVWDKTYRVPNVSLVHTHPWHFESYVVCGEIANWKYVEGEYHPAAEDYVRQTIHAGEGGGLVGEPTKVRLIRSYNPQLVWRGSFYKQQADEIHHTDFVDGTVTLCDRVVAGQDPHRALVYWPSNTVWVSAEPRIATEEEVLTITRKALEIL